MRFILSLIFEGFGQTRYDLLTAFIASLAVGAVFAVIPWGIDAIIDGFTLTQPVLLPVAGLMLVSALGYALFAAAQQRALHRFQLQISALQHANLMRYLLRLPPSAFQHNPRLSASDLPHYVLSFTQRLSISLVQILVGVIELSTLLTILRLWKALLIWFPVLALWVICNIGLQVLLYPALQTRQRALTHTTKMTIQNMPKFRMLGAVTALSANWEKDYSTWSVLDRLFKTLAWAQRLSQVLFPLMVLGFALPLMPGAALGLWWCAGLAAQLANDIIGWTFNLSMMMDFCNLLGSAPEPGSATPLILAGDIHVERVSFRYDPSSALVLNKMSLEVSAGECVAIVGTSGAGKSTLLRLLFGLETPDSGAVRYDSHDLSALDLSTIRSQVGVVMQDSRLETGSLWMNIAAFAPVPIDQVWEAARRANIDHTIAGLASKMHTLVDTGAAMFSHGQVQRLLLARALVNNPKILLLDEATNAVDDETERAIFENLHGLTRVIITTRLSTVRHADRIYVIHEGKVVESGNFETLMSQNNLFSDLMQRQQP